MSYVWWKKKTEIASFLSPCHNQLEIHHSRCCCMLDSIKTRNEWDTKDNINYDHNKKKKEKSEYGKNNNNVCVWACACMLHRGVLEIRYVSYIFMVQCHSTPVMRISIYCPRASPQIGQKCYRIINSDVFYSFLTAHKLMSVTYFSEATGYCGLRRKHAPAIALCIVILFLFVGLCNTMYPFNKISDDIIYCSITWYQYYLFLEGENSFVKQKKNKTHSYSQLYYHRVFVAYSISLFVSFGFFFILFYFILLTNAIVKYCRQPFYSFCEKNYSIRAHNKCVCIYIIYIIDK
jgi:hypothetical protein